MNLRIVYKVRHGERMAEHQYTGIARVREQCGNLEIWQEGQELTLHATAYVPIEALQFYEADCRVLDPDEAALYDELMILPDAFVKPHVPPLKEVIRAWLRKRYPWLQFFLR
jgi:hypothetical protein